MCSIYGRLISYRQNDFELSKEFHDEVKYAYCILKK